ncbi:fused MFS/spermidine synthase [bacterium]|nr:fused MFS/spermidine synthase [bacterium]
MSEDHTQNRSGSPHRLGAFFLGFTALSYQIVLLREFMVSFYGNELSAGIVLGIWLLMSGFGAWVGRVLLKTSLRNVLFYGHALIAVFVPLPLIGLVYLRTCWSITGEIVGFGPIIATALLVETAFCFISGFLFTKYCQMDYTHQRAWTSIGWIYFLDSLGSMSGGLLFSLLLVHLFKPLPYTVLLSSVNLGICLVFLISFRGRFYGTTCIFLTLVVILFCLCLPMGEALIMAQRWPNTAVLRNVFTKYGNLVITRSKEQITVYQNGLLFFSYPDALSAEENVHYALLQHPHPKHVLLIGGALGGELAEVLDHGPETVTYVELDPALIANVRTELGPFNDLLERDKRIQVITGDGRYYLSTTDHLFDVIIMNAPDPSTAQINRFYTQQFFEIVKSRLHAGGIFSFAVHSSENYIDDMLARYLAVMQATLSTVFRNVMVWPGLHCRFFASPDAPLTEKADLLIDRLEQRHLKPEFVNAYYLPFQLSRERKDYLDDRIESVPADHIRTNQDFEPISYYFDLILWSSRMNGCERALLLKIEQLSTSVYVLPLFFLILISALLSWRNKMSTSWFIGMPVAVIGFSEMALQLVLILSFQVLYGYAYYKIGILVTCCMAGISLGSYLATRGQTLNDKKALTILSGVQSLMIVYPLVLYGLLFIISKPVFQQFRSISVLVLFPLMAVAGGLIGGAHFPIAALTLQSNRYDLQSTAGSLFWYDLIGSGLGALVLGTFLIPLLGLTVTLIILTGLNCSAWVTLRLYQRMRT